MALKDAYTLGPIEINGSVLFPVTSSSLDHGDQKLSFNTDGEVDQAFIGLMKQSPRFKASTPKIDVIDTIGLDGLALSAAGLEQWFLKIDQDAHRVGGSSDQSRTIANGLAVLRTITASEGPVNASAEIEIIARSNDGTTSPHVIGTGDAPNALDNADVWTLGACSVNGTTIEEVTNVVFDTGMTEFVITSSGRTFPTLVAINQRAPTMTITSLDLTLAATMTEQALALNGTNGAVMSFKKMVRDSIVSATVRNITMLNGMATASVVEAVDGSNATLQITIEARKGTAAMWTTADV